jgi:hypothetical protein
MEGYTQSEYFILEEDDCEDDDEDVLKKTNVKYTLLKEEDFVEEED